jgi:hypothetical protein
MMILHLNRNTKPNQVMNCQPGGRSQKALHTKQSFNYRLLRSCLSLRHLIIYNLLLKLEVYPALS